MPEEVPKRMEAAYGAEENDKSFLIVTSLVNFNLKFTNYLFLLTFTNIK